MNFSKELLDELSKKLTVFQLNENKKAVKTQAYSISKAKKELITAKKEIYTFNLEPITRGVIPLVIEVDIKDKSEDEIGKAIFDEMYETISRKNFLRETLFIASEVTKEPINITPLLYNGDMIYILKYKNNKITLKNKKPTLKILKDIGIYQENDKAIDLYLLKFEKQEITEIFNKLLNKEEITDDDIYTIINSIQDRIEDEDDLSYYKIRSRCHQLVDKLYNHKILGTTHHCLLGRKKYIQIINTFSKEKYSKALSIRRVKEETDDPYILYNPQTMQYIYQSEFNDVPEKYKSYFNNIEDRLMRFWKTAQDNINKANNSEIDICLVGYNLLTGTYIVNVFSKDSFTGEKFISKKNFQEDINLLIKEFS